VSDLPRHWPSRLSTRTDLRDRLLAAYSARHRRYHDTRHLAEVLGHLEALLGQAGPGEVDRDCVVLAGWYHDAVYDGRPDDEERSALLAEESLTAVGQPAPLVAEVARLVRLTRDHRPSPDDLAGQILCDADLAILAAARERYDEYVRDVRAEYAHLDDEAFRTGRAAVLRRLLQGPVFHTPLARGAWEERGRANLARELDSLER